MKMSLFMPQDYVATFIQSRMNFSLDLVAT